MEFSSVSLTKADYEVLQELGTGSFGRVDLILLRSDQCLYAMKSVSFGKLNHKDKSNAINQVRLLASIKLANVIGYKGAFVDNESMDLCIIMEYAEGGDLQKLIRNRRKIGPQSGLDQKMIWKVSYEILKALEGLHENKIVHRDVKSANIFFCGGIAKLGDLNVSKVMEADFCSTQTGTPYYTAPEIWKGEKYTEKCDIWSLGCLLYEMCQLVPPFRDKDFPSLLKKVVLGEYQPIANHYSEDLHLMLRKCLTVNPQLRPSAAQLLSEIPNLVQIHSSLSALQNHSPQQGIHLLDPGKCAKALKLGPFLEKGNKAANGNKIRVTSKKNLDKDEKSAARRQLSQKSISSKRKIDEQCLL